MGGGNLRNVGFITSNNSFLFISITVVIKSFFPFLLLNSSKLIFSGNSHSFFSACFASKYRTKNVGSREKEKNWVEKD